MTRDLEEFNGIHKGRKCFIVGAGPSLHFQDISPLVNHVTITVNSGYLAFKEADYFITDDHATANWSYFYKDLKESTKTNVLLYEDKLKNSTKLFGNRSVLFRHRKGYHITDKYEHNNKINHICQARTSTGSAIHVAHIMGCSEIFLLGLDCCRIEGKRYFWQFRNNQPTRSDGIPIDNYHKTIENGTQSDSDLKEIHKYWNNTGKLILNKCKVYNASGNSVLNTFPKVNLEDCL